MNPWGELPGDLDPVARDRIDRYFALLADECTRHNLTADPAERWVARHLADAFALPPQNGRFADVGAGAGFLGVLLAIRDPALSMRLIESQGKRARFLATVVAELGLARVVVDQRRAETCGRDPALRDVHDGVVARALAPPAVTAELVLPLVRNGGRAWLWLGSDGARALEGEVPLDRLGARLGDVTEYRLPGDERPRFLARIDKVARTDGRYPRRDGVPAKEPLARA